MNTGSSFNMSGTSTLTIIRGGGTSSYGDLYLRPESSSVTGGTIYLQPVTGITAAEESFKIDANISLNNLTINGFAAADAAIASLLVNPLVVNGNLTLSDGFSTLTANNLDVTIGGNFTNSGVYNYGTNTTRFTGNTQSILGTTISNFYNLVVSPVNSLTVNNNFNVTGNLTISSGTLVLANRRLTLQGNITNNGTYTDDNNTGGVSLNGTSLQQVYGTGSFGRLELNNIAGARINNNITLQNNLVLTTGNLDINAYQLILELNSNIGGSPFTLNNMIISDGVASSPGVRKFFNIIASPTSFTFPVGVSGKYTPAILTINANSAVGYINVNPINNNHPAVVDPNSVLNYYWNIESSGITNFAGNFALKYMSSDVRGTESSYIAARLLLPGTSWSKATPGPLTDNVDESTQTIMFTMPTGTNNLNGDYTAGTDAAIPDDVPSYITISDGDWSDETIWAPVGGSDPCPVGGPNGFVVTIDHQVRTDVNYCFAYATTINNLLSIENPTYGHNLGLVDGNGKIVMGSGNMPAGNYSSFLTCGGGGTLEYGGSGTYSIIASQYNTVPNLSFTGSGTRILPSRDLTICNRMVIDGPLVDNSVNNKSLILRGTMERYNTGSFHSGSGSTATVSFQGTAAQALGGVTGSFNGADGFNNLEINNINGLTIGTGTIEINGNLLLTSGIISTSSTNRLVITNTLSACVFPSAGSANSFVAGPLSKNITAGNTFIYPIGTGTTPGHTFTVTSGAGSTALWTAEYFSPNGTASSFTTPLQAVNNDEYWSLSASSTRNGSVKMAWDIYSAITPLMTQNGISDMRAAAYTAGSWQELQTNVTGNNNAGDVSTANQVSISSTATDFTLASVSSTTPRASMAPVGAVCGNEGIPLEFTASSPIPFNYRIFYTINGSAQTPVVITSLPYILPTAVPGVYQLTGFTYDNDLNTGVVDPAAINIYSAPTTADAGPDQSLCGVSGTTLAGNNPAPYTGIWTIVSGSGGTLVNSSLYNATFTGVLGGTYTLRWTISNVSCTSSDDVIITFPVAASRPSNFTSAPSPVCQGSSGNIYTVPDVPGYSYNWLYSGTGCTINGTGSSVTLDFSPSATSGTLSVTATNACGTSSARSVNITVNPLPVATFSYTGSPYCQNDPNPLPVFSGGGIAGTFSSTAGLAFISTSTGQIDLIASTPGTYTVTNTIAAAGGCGVVIATSSFSIRTDQTWTGAVNSDWNNPGNWSCGYVPDSYISVQIPDVSNEPVLNPGPEATVNNLDISSGSSFTVIGNTLKILGTISNSGTLTANDGTIELNGNTAQSVGSVFAGNEVKNLTINNPAGVILTGQVGVSGILKAESGSLSSGGNLTLLSTNVQTALIDGSGSGSVTGNVTMQRYLPSSFGYKYLSSPFQAATTGEFGDEIVLGSFVFYRYDESRSASGWVSYSTPTNILNPLEGYAINFGTSILPITADITGVVNNGSLSVTLFNHNNTFTQGFNLIGNPYPSPIDWDAATGWTKTNIDNALYYFKASTSDQYGGIYSTYINGISSDGTATAIIPSMQAFFVHVSDGSWPITGVLGMNNSVRVTDLTHPITKSDGANQSPLLRLTAAFADDAASSDPLVIYFDEKAATGYDSNLDAIKLLNTDLKVANLYTMSPEGKKLSINALPEITGDFCNVPLGIKVNRSGNVIFKIRSAAESLKAKRIYIADIVAGTEQDLLPDKEYSVNLEKGEYNNRFFLNLSNITTGNNENTPDTDLFSIYSTYGILKSEIGIVAGNYGTLRVYNISGQIMLIEKIYTTGYHEFDKKFKDGIYIVNYTTGTFSSSKKLFIDNQ
ncbi:MAG: T9SS type A sorting domain-containing protein [Bacteroidales bacterium]|nr:T9SS type A sorting domain-containing protein [Bacteroidales bacterium]